MSTARPTETKKTAQEQKDDNLKELLEQIHVDAVYLKDSCGPNGTGLSADFDFRVFEWLTAQYTEFAKTSALYNNKAPDVGVLSVYKKFKSEHHESESHKEAFRKVMKSIETERSKVAKKLNEDVTKTANLLLNKEDKRWEKVDIERWKKTFEEGIRPLISEIDSEIKTINEKKEGSAEYGYKEDAGKVAYEKARAYQIKLLEDYKAQVLKEVEQLEYNVVLETIKNQKYRKKNNLGQDTSVPVNAEYGASLDLHQHAHQQFMLRTQLAIGSGRLKTACHWLSKRAGGEIDLAAHTTDPLAEDIYTRGDRWRGWKSYLSWHALMDAAYDVKKDSVGWKASSYRFSSNATLDEEIDGALAFYNQQTGDVKQKGFLNAGKEVDPNYLIRFAERAVAAEYQFQLTEDTRKHLGARYPDKLAEIEAALGAKAPVKGKHIQVQAQEGIRSRL